MQQWTRLKPAERKELVEEYNAHGIAVMFSVFGSEGALEEWELDGMLIPDRPTSFGVDAVVFAREVANFTKAYDFDGVDIDYEDFAAVDLGTALPWLIGGLA